MVQTVAYMFEKIERAADFDKLESAAEYNSIESVAECDTIDTTADLIRKSHLLSLKS